MYETEKAVTDQGSQARITKWSQQRRMSTDILKLQKTKA